MLGAPEELVDMALAECTAVVVALALDRHPFSRRPPGNEVDSDVAAVLPGQRHALRPVSPAPNPVDLEFGLLQHDTHEQLLEPAALLGRVPTLRADAVEDLACGWPSSEIKTLLFGRSGVSSWHGTDIGTWRARHLARASGKASR